MRCDEAWLLDLGGGIGSGLEWIECWRDTLKAAATTRSVGAVDVLLVHNICYVGGVGCGHFCCFAARKRRQEDEVKSIWVELKSIQYVLMIGAHN